MIDFAVIYADYETIIESSELIDIKLILYVFDIANEYIIFNIQSVVSDVHVEVLGGIDELQFLVGLRGVFEL